MTTRQEAKDHVVGGEAEDAISGRRKRERTPSEIESTTPGVTFTHGKRHRSLADPGLDVLELHEVACDGERLDESSHKGHPKRTVYYDCPRLGAGDTQASHLQGTKPVYNEKRLLEDYGVVVYHKHDCASYMATMEKDFINFAPPGLDPHTFRTHRALYHVLKKDGQPSAPFTIEIRVSSPTVVSAMSALIKAAEGIRGTWNSPRNLSCPFPWFFHHRKNLRKAAHNEGILKQSLESLNSALSLLDLVENLSAGDYQEGEDLFQGGYVNRQHFDKLFCVGDTIAARRGEVEHAYILEELVGGSTSGALPLTLKCWSWAFDGKFSKSFTTIKIPEIDDGLLVPITDLPAYPIRYAATDLINTLAGRGKKFCKCRSRKYIQYTARRLPLEPRTSRPRYMIDYEMYNLMHPKGDDRPAEDDAEAKSLAIMPEDEIPDSVLIILPAFIHGYSLQDKDWRKRTPPRNLDVSCIEDIPWNKEIFEKGLVFDETTKNIIKGLVLVHLETTRSADIIEGKGNGLIILLHGGPGTGKTLTAESVAELAKKPLYRVTCGDIGVEAAEVEKYLTSVFHIGSAWGCVVLLDEADVFLEERTKFDLKRNALVSVFLRTLEYFEGILILTTNRIGTFDEAFKSRVQLAVHYPFLSKTDRLTIWRYALQDLYKFQQDFDIERMQDKVYDLAEHKLNGRQIRNIVNSARQLAHHGGQGLNYAHFAQIIKIVTEFEDYVQKAKKGLSEDYVQSGMFEIQGEDS